MVGSVRLGRCPQRSVARRGGGKEGSGLVHAKRQDPNRWPIQSRGYPRWRYPRRCGFVRGGHQDPAGSASGPLMGRESHVCCSTVASPCRRACAEGILARAFLSPMSATARQTKGVTGVTGVSGVSSGLPYTSKCGTITSNEACRPHCRMQGPFSAFLAPGASHMPWPATGSLLGSGQRLRQQSTRAEGQHIRLGSDFFRASPSPG